MNHVDYLKRLGLQGGRLVWRVLMILGPVVGYSLWQLIKSAAAESGNQSDEKEPKHGYYSDGTPWVENVAHPQWEAYYGDDHRR